MIREISSHDALRFIKRTKTKEDSITLNSNGKFYGFFKNDEIVGIISTAETKNTIRIKQFLVDPAHRKSKVGTALLFWVLEGDKKFTAFATENSYKLFEKMGFKETKINNNGIRFMEREGIKNEK